MKVDQPVLMYLLAESNSSSYDFLNSCLACLLWLKLAWYLTEYLLLKIVLSLFKYYRYWYIYTGTVISYIDIPYTNMHLCTEVLKYLHACTIYWYTYTDMLIYCTDTLIHHIMIYTDILIYTDKLIYWYYILYTIYYILNTDIIYYILILNL